MASGPSEITSYRHNPGVVSQPLGEGLLLLHMATGATFRLNGSGKRIWELLEQGSPFDQILERMQSHYSVSAERLEQDVRSIFQALNNSKLIEPICAR